jgi:hypothetical protein
MKKMVTSGQEERSIWAKIAFIDFRVIYIIYILVLSVFVITPIGLPIPIREMTKIAVNYVETEIEPGDVVVVDVSWARGSLNTEPLGLVLCGHLLEHGAKILATRGSIHASPYPMDSLKAYVEKWTRAGKLPEGLEYGKDWVYIAPLGLGEVPKQAFAKDIWGMGSDFYGTPLSEIPMMENLKTVDDCKALYWLSDGEHIEWVRQWPVVYNIDSFAFVLGGNVPQFMPYYPMYVKAVLADIRSAAEYESMAGFLGVGVASMDALSAAIILVLLMVITGNVAHFAMKQSERER